MAKERARYSNWVKQQVKLRYPLCRTTEDKRQLALELGILDADGQPSVPKLYNLASRLGATGRDESKLDAASVAGHDDRLKERENPDEVKLTREAERYMRNEFGRKPIEWIAVHLHHTETAVAYWARQLGLRRPAQHWNARKVAYWLGLDMEDLHALRGEGIDIFPLFDQPGHLRVEVVSTTSLARWLTSDGILDRVRAGGADEFFLREILESVDHARSDDFERCKFLSHGHVCQNPYASETSFGMYCPKTDKWEAGMDKFCAWRNLHIEDLRPDANAA